MATTPPASPVPEPLGMTGNPCRAARRTMVTTSSVLVGKAIRLDSPRTSPASLPNTCRSRGSDATFSAPNC